MSKSSIAVVTLIVILLVSGIAIVNLASVSSAYCSVWNYAGHGSPPGYTGCSGSTASSGSTTSSSSESSSSSPTSSSFASSSSSSIRSGTSNGAVQASLSLSSNSFQMTAGGASAVVSFVIQTTGPVNLTVVGASNFVIYAYCVQSQCVQNDGILSVGTAGTYQGLISATALATTSASTYTSSFEAVSDNQPIITIPISAVVGSGSSNYFCTEQSFNINITRALIEPNGEVYSSTPLQSLIGTPKTPLTPIVAYDTKINAVPILGATGSFLVTYEVLGTGPISTNTQPQMLTQGDGWKLFEFQQSIPASGGSFDVYMNTTDMLWGEYYAGLDSNTQTLLSNAGLNGNQIWILYYMANATGADVIYGNVSIQGCNGVSSELQFFDDALLIPTTATRTLASTTTSNCIRVCKESLVPLNLFSPPSLSILKFPSGGDAFLIGLADSLVLGGIALAAGAVIYYLKEQ